MRECRDHGHQCTTEGITAHLNDGHSHLLDGPRTIPSLHAHQERPCIKLKDGGVCAERHTCVRGCTFHPLGRGHENGIDERRLDDVSSFARHVPLYHTRTHTHTHTHTSGANIWMSERTEGTRSEHKLQDTGEHTLMSHTADVLHAVYSAPQKWQGEKLWSSFTFHARTPPNPAATLSTKRSRTNDHRAGPHMSIDSVPLRPFFRCSANIAPLGEAWHGAG